MFTGQISFKVGSISWELEESTLKSLQSIEALKVQYCADGIGLTQFRSRGGRFGGKI